MILSIQLDSRSAIEAAKCALKRHKGRFCFGNEKAESGFYELGLLTAQERQMAVDFALGEIGPECRLGPQPPNDRSAGLYRGKQLYAFCWHSAEFKKQIYFKFAFASASDGDHLIVYSFHESTDKQTEASQ